MRRTSYRVLIACFALLAGCGDDSAEPSPTPELDVGPLDAGATRDAAIDAHVISSGDSAPQPQSSWRLPTPGACGDTPLLSLSEPAGGAPDWTKQAKVPITGRANRYGLERDAYLSYVRSGRLHTVDYPVSVTGSWLPKKLMDVVFTADDKTDLWSQLRSSGNPLAVYKDLADFESWLGLSPYPDCDGKGAQSVPYPGGTKPDFLMGSSRVMSEDGEKLTYSCAGCHASKLFGRSVLGLQNRASRANTGIDKARLLLKDLPIWFLRGIYPEMTDGEQRILERLQDALSYVNIKTPLLRGLDTSLTQVAISLAKRAKDPYATRDPNVRSNPRPDRLDTHPSDSKPGNWWVLKYKNRWLLDGSVVSGNPVYTNLLWNEIGRGTDLHELEAWLDANQKVVDELTAAVFAAEPVRFTEFFAPESLDLEAAKRGKLLFDGTCATCHGTYQKGWELPHAASLPLPDRLATVEVRYHEDTPVFDVGTDTLRNQGMESLLQLNDLAISKKSGTVIEVQQGYVPPPLVGIWARFPYFHNNSAPSLCAVLTRATERPVTYYGGEQDDAARDFDRDCNGYPSGEKVPEAWLKDPESLYDSTRVGLGNQGHDEGVFLKNGVEMFTPEQKRDIITFLQTL
ncbi:MAG TPA: hypothetical protein VFX59_20525 [Polyangiales bacterium]|nr:hypothetical protein [Polyangiales bacterium]